MGLRNLGIKEIKDIIERIRKGQVFDVRATESIAQAEEWQKDDYRVEDISSDQIIMKKELEKILFREKLEHDKEFRKKVLEEHCYSQADLYKTPKEDANSQVST